jgi:uncharacterized membrane protein YeaQ/YmgE (transglycosylase-associated protein family)
MIDFAVWVVLGALLGWLSSAISGGSGPGKMLNLLAGVVGAYLAALIVTPLFGGGSQDGSLSLMAIMFALGGAVVLLWVVNSPKRGRVH